MIEDNFEGDIEMAQFSAKLFLETYPDVSGTFGEVIEKKDPKLLNDKAHALKGVTNQIGAKKVGEIFYELEKMGSENSVEGSEELFEKLKPLLEKLNREAKILSEFEP